MMAAPTVVPSSSSSFSASRWTHDVFLNFRGEDTRDNFTSDLYNALVGKGIGTFMDDKKLKIGEHISAALIKAIKESRFAIVIFSRKYANSRWCLEELALIMEFREKHGQKVFPVFLTDVDPLDVQHQSGSFGESFGVHELRFDREMVERWRSALKAASELSGWNLEHVGSMAPHTVLWNYDVFLSYEGEGILGNINLASNLCAYLERAKIKTLKRDENLIKGGDQISAALMKGIKESRIAIVIFSRNYAYSAWCLEELALIMECWEKLGQKVFPVFLMGVEGSHVRRQMGSFEEAFSLHQECFEREMVERWRSALRAAGELCGWNLKDVPFCDEEELIEMIVEEVLTERREMAVGDREHPTADRLDNTYIEAATSSRAPHNVLKSLIPCTIIAERQLLADTETIVKKNKSFKIKDDCRKFVTDELISLGYDASICKSRWENTPSYPAGVYEYIDVIVNGDRLLIDVDFRSEFEIARSTEKYRAVLQTLPAIFVGKPDRLQQIVSVVSYAAKQSLKAKGMHFPPWRKAEYMTAKWLSPYTRTSSVSAKSTATEIATENKKKSSLITTNNFFSLPSHNLYDILSPSHSVRDGTSCCLSDLENELELLFWSLPNDIWRVT